MPRKPRELEHLTYGTWEPLLAWVDRVREPLLRLGDAVDDLELAICRDNLSERDVERALAAYRELIGHVDAFERTVAPRHLATLRRRARRIQGVLSR